MADILIKNIGLPTEDEQVNITILSDGSVIEHFRNENGKWSSYRSGGVTAIELPEHGEAKDTDIAIKYIKSEMEDDFNKTTTLDEKSYKEGMKRAIELIGYAPTVLEANNGSDN